MLLWYLRFINIDIKNIILQNLNNHKSLFLGLTGNFDLFLPQIKEILNY